METKEIDGTGFFVFELFLFLFPFSHYLSIPAKPKINLGMQNSNTPLCFLIYLLGQKDQIKPQIRNKIQKRFVLLNENQFDLRFAISLLKQCSINVSEVKH